MRRSYWNLFLVSFLILFFELAAIRFFGSTVVFLTFFTNIVLLACFLGMSVGLLAARGRHELVPTALPAAMLAVGAAVVSHRLYWHWADALAVTVGDQHTSPAIIYFGTEFRPADPTRWVIPIWAIGGAFFGLIALSFVGLGQAMGRAFDAIPDRLVAYSIDIAGSLTGIAAFALMSYLQLPPTTWFAPVVVLMLYFAGWRKPWQLVAAVTLFALAAMGSSRVGGMGPLKELEVFWSPYYKVAYSSVSNIIATNDIGHQQMINVGERGPVYTLPYALNGNAGGAPFEKVMIIGAGSGNDVSAALRSGAKSVDAVEIDPRIQELGRHHHPNAPYADPRVSVYLDDGRNFVRHTNHKYDLAVYALVDSLVLHSGYSSLRLENFLFTREAFRDVKRALAPGGVFVVYNYFRQGWVIARLAEMAEETFGAKPLVFNLPYREEIKATDSQKDQWTMLIVGSDAGRLAAIRRQFEQHGNFWLSERPVRGETMNAFGRSSPGDGFVRVAPTHVDPSSDRLLPSDDWPHLYLREATIPWAPIGQGMLVIAALSLLILFVFAPPRRVRPNAQMFFLGAGFMLLETKGVVHMALLFGSTWVVNLLVFFAILVMVLCANVYVLKRKPARLPPYYALLIVALLFNALVPMNTFLNLPPIPRAITSCLVVFVPVFFAGVIFATIFRKSTAPDVDLGSNVAGIILGGLSEQLSLVVGFNGLLFVAIGFYLCSFVFRPRGTPAALR